MEEPTLVYLEVKLKHKSFDTVNSNSFLVLCDREKWNQFRSKNQQIAPDSVSRTKPPGNVKWNYRSNTIKLFKLQKATLNSQFNIK